MDLACICRIILCFGFHFVRSVVFVRFFEELDVIHVLLYSFSLVDK